MSGKREDGKILNIDDPNKEKLIKAASKINDTNDYSPVEFLSIAFPENLASNERIISTVQKYLKDLYQNGTNEFLRKFLEENI